MLLQWNFGSTTTVGGRMSNVLWNGYSYLIQQSAFRYGWE